MPRGVTDQFLQILRDERKTSVRTALTMTGLFGLAYFMAELADKPLLGRVVILSFIALAVGLVAGLLYARHRTEAYNHSLRESWNAWMRMSLSCRSVDEVARHVAHKAPAPPLAGVGWGVLFMANALLFALLWIEAGAADVAGVLVTGVNGVVLGALIGHSLWSLRWTSQFSKALDDLVAQGQVGLWGEL